MENKRNYGIDLLRLVLMYMVCVLHILGQGGILGASVYWTIGFNAYWLLEIFSYCAVDGFALISGYMASNKIVDMWFQVFFYSFVITMFFVMFGEYDLSKREIIKCMMPVTYGKYWYFTAFFGLFFAIPVLNRFIFSITDDIAKKSLIIIVFLFSLMGFLSDPFVSNAGYSMIWLMVLYCIGALSKKVRLFESKKSLILFVLWILCIVFTWAMYIFTGNNILVSYISPTVLLSGMIMVILFSRLQLNSIMKKIVVKFSPLAFGVYLLQLNQFIWNDLLYNAFTFVTIKNVIIGILYVLVFAFLMFIIGVEVEWIRKKFFKFLKISLLSKKVVYFVDIFINKLFIFMS